MAGKLQFDGPMERRAYLRTVSLAVPGFLLTGWAPARAALRTVHLVVREDGGPSALALHAGVELGLDEVTQSARVLQVPLAVHRGTSAEAGRAVPSNETGVEVVVALADRTPHTPAALPCGPRIHTCPLEEWRQDAWSVASAAAAHHGTMRLDWHPGLDSPAAAQLTARCTRKTGVPMDQAAWRGWMAVKVAFEAALRLDAGEDDLLALRFDGHKGHPLRFAEDGHLIQPTYRIAGERVALVSPVDHDLFADLD